MTEPHEFIQDMMRSTPFVDPEWNYPSHRPAWLIGLSTQLGWLVGDDKVIFASSNLGGEQDDPTKVSRVVYLTDAAIILATVDFTKSHENPDVAIRALPRRSLKQVVLERLRSNGIAVQSVQLRLEYESEPEVVIPVHTRYMDGLVEATSTALASLKNDLR